MMKITLHKAQMEVAQAPHRFKVVCAGRRFGKGVLSRAILYKWATEKEGTYWIVSPTYQMAKDIHWKQGILMEFPQQWIAKKNESELEIITINGSRIALRSAENPDRLRGVKLNGLIVDEVAFIKNWDDVWENALRQTLTDYQAPAIFISTPQGYNAFFDLYQKGLQGDPNWKSWHFTTYDNPFIKKEEIELSKKELPEEAFQQEIMAEFKKFTGLVYKDFSREKHLIKPFELLPSYTYYRSIDFGFVNPTAVIFALIDDKGRLIAYDEIYQKGLQTPDLANLITQKSVGKQFANTFADSAQASDIAELQKYGISIMPVSKTSGSATEDWTTYRIRKVSEKLRNGTLLITENCQNLLFEFENHQYQEVNKNGIIREQPMKINDHLLDALSYLIVSIPQINPVEFKPFLPYNFSYKLKNWKIG